MKFSLGQIRSDFDGFHRITELGSQDFPGGCEIDMSNWVDGNMCAPLGAILYRKKMENVRISISDIPQSIESSMQKNHFLSQFGGAERPDSYGTTIEYRRFETVASVHGQFQKYVVTYFRPKSRGLPQMTPALLKKFRESLFEVFLNATEHSDTRDGIFACGQFFPQRRKLHFTIADLGIGIDGSVLKNLGVRLLSEDAIKWALRGKTTRRGRSGGLGLQLIQEFIRLNNGRLIIVSGEGYWMLSKGQISTHRFSNRFPGTAVTIVIDTADRNSYCLRSEIDASDIF